MDGDINALRIDTDKALKNTLPANLLTALKTVDGAGTGLDADKLDGVELSTIYSKYDIHILNTEYLNDITTPGVYSQRLNENATYGKNYPSLSAGLLEVNDLSSGFILQRYTTYTGAVYTRYYQNWGTPTWAGWVVGNLRSGVVVVSSVTANTMGTVSVTINEQPINNNIHCFIIGGIMGMTQLNSRSGATFTFGYQFVANGTNRTIFYWYYI